MKITIGGAMGFKVQGLPYESIDASAVFTVEKEFPDGTPINSEEIEKISDKVNKILTSEAMKKIKIAVKEYHGQVTSLKDMPY